MGIWKMRAACSRRGICYGLNVRPASPPSALRSALPLLFASPTSLRDRLPLSVDRLEFQIAAGTLPRVRPSRRQPDTLSRPRRKLPGSIFYVLRSERENEGSRYRRVNSHFATGSMKRKTASSITAANVGSVKTFMPRMPARGNRIS